MTRYKDFVRCAFVLLLTYLLCQQAGAIPFASAEGETNPNRPGLKIGEDLWLFHNFEVTETLVSPEVGVSLETYTQTEMFAAIVELDGPEDVPDSIDLSTPDLVGTTAFQVESTEGEGLDRSVIMPLTLQPGWYALGFGTGAFGVPPQPWTGTLPRETDLLPDAHPYGLFQSGHFANPNIIFSYRGHAFRFFVNESQQQGDYNSDGRVDAADYTVWRDTLGSDTDLTADGDGNGEVGPEDYDVWKNAYGVPAAAVASSSIPEPSALTVALLLATSLLHGARKESQ